MVALLLALQLRTITIDQRLAADAHLRVGDTVMVSAAPGSDGDSVVIAAIIGRRADPSEIARSEYRAHLHLDQLQRLIGYGDRVDRFAISTHGDSAADAPFARSTMPPSVSAPIARATSPSRRPKPSPSSAAFIARSA